MNKIVWTACLGGLLVVSASIRAEQSRPVDTRVVAKLDLRETGRSMTGEWRFDLRGGPLKGRVSLDLEMDPSVSPRLKSGEPSAGRLVVEIDFDGVSKPGLQTSAKGAVAVSGRFVDKSGAESIVKGKGIFSGSINAPIGRAEAVCRFDPLEFQGGTLQPTQAIALPEFPSFEFPATEVLPPDAKAPPDEPVDKRVSDPGPEGGVAKPKVEPKTPPRPVNPIKPKAPPEPKAPSKLEGPPRLEVWAGVETITPRETRTDPEVKAPPTPVAPAGPGIDPRPGTRTEPDPKTPSIFPPPAGPETNPRPEARSEPEAKAKPIPDAPVSSPAGGGGGGVVLPGDQGNSLLPVVVGLVLLSIAMAVAVAVVVKRRPTQQPAIPGARAYPPAVLVYAVGPAREPREARVRLTGPTSIGRAPSSTIKIDDPQASRDHAVIEFSAGQWTLRDLGSANGTRLNGVPVRSQALKDADVIQIGECDIHFRTDSRP